MEFLVRLEDKVNIQVFCFNPTHKGNHMDRVFFEDNTFGAPCPECGSDGWLYRKNNAITKKGHFITFKSDGWSWGENERKHYGIIRIDCTEEQAKEWCKGLNDPKDIINYRPRKLSFDFEKVLSISELKNWNDKREFSKVITQETINMKAI